MNNLGAVALMLAAASAVAQHQTHAGQHDGEIKALSTKEIEQYRAGAGMGYAKAAELNHFPGPMHVLELADQLKLSASQRVATRNLMDAHKAEARAIASLIAREMGKPVRLSLDREVHGAVDKLRYFAGAARLFF
jgi:delta 1-pyrroline-5-carboxylate dehydrogenase